MEKSAFSGLICFRPLNQAGYRNSLEEGGGLYFLFIKRGVNFFDSIKKTALAGFVILFAI